MIRQRVAELRWRYSPYWRGYRAGLSARERGIRQAKRMQRAFESPALLCPAGCDCSCCYGYTDKSCHCFRDRCNCGGGPREHG